MEYGKLINGLIDHLEGNLYKDISYSEITDQYPLSEYHFHQLFKAVIGYSLDDYIEKRRISDQMYRWASSKRSYSMTDVAKRCQLKNQRIFNKKLKQHFNTTSKEYYNTFEGYELFPNFNYYKYLNNPARSNIEIDTNIVNLNAFRLYGHSSTLKHEDFHLNKKTTTFRVISNSKFAETLEYTSFLGSKEYKDNVEVLDIPTQLYICFTGLSDDWFFEQATRYIYRTYLIDESVEVGNDTIEIIIENNFEKTFNGYHTVKVFMPIKNSDL